MFEVEVEVAVAEEKVEEEAGGEEEKGGGGERKGAGSCWRGGGCVCARPSLRPPRTPLSRRAVAWP